MAKIKRLNDSDKIYDVNDLNHVFYMIHDLNYRKNDYMEFIVSLNLTNEQYRKLADIIEDYGKDQYMDGRADGDIGPEY